MQKLKEIGFKRCTLPLHKEVLRTSLVCFCDAGKSAKVQVVYLLHEIDQHHWHPQLLYAKSQLAQANKTLPNMELDSLNTGAELLNSCTKALPNITRACLVGDSLITSFWVAKDSISLATYQRNRVLNIRRLVEIENIFHCRGTENISDIGTKKEDPLSSILPGSRFNTGPQFLTGGIDKAIEQKHLTPIMNITIQPDNELWNNVADGLIGKCSWPNELLQGHTDSAKQYPVLAINEQWVNQVNERYLYSDYLLDPLKRPWESVIRSKSILFYFIHCTLKKLINSNKHEKQRKKWSERHQRIFILEKENKEMRQTLGSLAIVDERPIIGKEMPAKTQDMKSNFASSHLDKPLLQTIATLSDQIPLKTRNLDLLDIFGDGMTANLFKGRAILYYIQKASREVESFYTPSVIRKHCFKSGSILFSKNRWLETTS